MDLTSVRLPPDKSLPLRPIPLRMVRQMPWPRTANDVLRPGALEHDLVRQAAALAQDEEIERIAEMPVVHDRVVGRVRAPQPHLPARPLREERRHHGERLLAGSGRVPAGLRAVALRVPHLDVGLLVREAHGVAARAAAAAGLPPQVGVGEAVVQSGVGEGAEGELREEARLVLLVLREGFGLGALVPDEVVGRQVGL